MPKARFLLVHVTCRHMRTKSHPVIWTCARTQETKRDLRSKSFFWTRRTVSAATVSRMPKHKSGLDVHATWKSVLLSPNRGCENTFCCLTPGPLTVLHVLLPLLPSITQHFGEADRQMEFFFIIIPVSVLCFRLFICCLIWIDKARAQNKTYTAGCCKRVLLRLRLDFVLATFGFRF